MIPNEYNFTKMQYKESMFRIVMFLYWMVSVTSSAFCFQCFNIFSPQKYHFNCIQTFSFMEPQR